MEAIIGARSSQDMNASESLFSLLDQSWYCQSVLKSPGRSVVSKFDEADSEVVSSRYSGDSETLSTVCTCSAATCRANTVDEEEMRKVFEKFDENADGSICKKDLQRFMRVWGIDLSDAEVSSMIESVDSNKDGSVDFSEFLALYRTCIRDRKTMGEDFEEKDDLLEAFLVFDRNQDGFISAEELQAVLSDLGMPEGKSLWRCEKMIRNVDKDNNGKCDLQEFQSMMTLPVF